MAEGAEKSASPEANLISNGYVPADVFFKEYGLDPIEARVYLKKNKLFIYKIGNKIFINKSKVNEFLINDLKTQDSKMASKRKRLKTIKESNKSEKEFILKLNSLMEKAPFNTAKINKFTLVLELLNELMLQSELNNTKFKDLLNKDI